MTAFYVPLALFLAVVFAVSAIGKFRSSDRGRAGFDALLIPVAHPNAATAVVIVAEAIVSIGLVVTTGWSFVAASGAAVVLTTGLLLVVARAHRLGATDDCGCFGDWMPAPIGPRLVSRNILLVVIATSVFIIALTGEAVMGISLGVPQAFAAGRPGTVTALGALLALLLIALATWATARASIDISAPPAHGGGAVVVPATDEVVDVLAPGARARLLVFVSPGCHACATVLMRLRQVEKEVDAFADVYVMQRVIHGSIGMEAELLLPCTARFALDIGGSVGAALDVGVARPVVALIGADGDQAGPLAVGSDEAAVLIDSIVSLTEAPTT